MKKRISILLAVSLALLCFAIPAVASPPGGSPVVEAMSFDSVDVTSNYLAQDKEPAPIIGSQVSAHPAPDVYAVKIEAASTTTVCFEPIAASAATLADFKARASSDMSAYNYDPRDRLQALARDQTAGALA